MRTGTMPGWAAMGRALAADGAGAANAPYQAFFFQVCGSASSTLATRCDETPNGLGNLSGDSESSLNPSQALGHNRSLVDAAQARGDTLRNEAARPDAAARVEFGPFALLANVYGTWFEREAGTTLVAERALDGESTGAEIGLDYRLSERAVLGALIGIERSDYDFVAENPGTNFVPQLRVEYQHDFDDDPQTVTSGFVLDPAANAFTLTGEAADESSVEATVSLSAVFANGWNGFIDYAVLLSSDDLDRERLTLGLRKEF